VPDSLTPQAAKPRGRGRIQSAAGENQLQEGEAEQHRGPTTIFKRVQSVGLVLPELGGGHLTGRGESRYAGEQSDQDQQAQDQFDQKARQNG
jgi:hypothetical protein